MYPSMCPPPQNLLNMDHSPKSVMTFQNQLRSIKTIMPDKEVNGEVVIVGLPQLSNAESPPSVRRHYGGPGGQGPNQPRLHLA
jgi:hypothetical protein